MTRFKMLQYSNRRYPDDIPLRIQEIDAHFDVKGIRETVRVKSLHTEYSYGARRFDTDIVSGYPEIIAAQKNGIPKLWKNEAWANQFADFIFSLVGDRRAPGVIEIHPPINDYTDIPGFIHNYSVFEEKISERYPGTEILIKNRCGSRYHG